MSLIRLIFFLLLFAFADNSVALAKEPYDVLVVFSYEQDYLWNEEVREGLEKALKPYADLTFFYMNTKVALEQGAEKAAEAYALYQLLHPDGVIAVDDNAQTLFVVPYLKNKTATPVVFCGVNADPESYGYPAKNVTGVLERYHFEETLSLNRQLAGRTETFAVMVNKSPLAQLVVSRLEKEKDKLSARLVAVLQPETLAEAIDMAKEYREKVDLLMLLTLKGIVDARGVHVSDKKAISSVVDAFNKPTAATAFFVIKNGALSGVLASGQEQGNQAALFLTKLLNGVSITELPITRNYRGKRMINVTTMKKLGILPEPMTLRGATLIRSE
jgi:ABC-type uncharacterized transport system substrate-binding protein